jgi:hypothetical protein
MPYLTSDLLASVRRRTFAPTGQNTFTNTDILAFGDEELSSLVIPALVELREEYFLTFSDQSITAGVNAYAVPNRAIGMAVREIKLVDSSGGYTDIPQITPESLRDDTTGSPEGFYMRDNSIILWPRPAASVGTLRIFFLRQHSKLVETSSAAVISSLSNGNLTANVNAVPSTFAVGDTYDIIKSTGGQEIINTDLSVTNLGTSSIDFTNALASTTQAGWYIAEAGETPLISLPPEYRHALAQAVAVRMLKSMRMKGWDVEQKTLEQMLESAAMVASPRVIGEQTKILSVWDE